MDITEARSIKKDDVFISRLIPQLEAKCMETTTEGAKLWMIHSEVIMTLTYNQISNSAWEFKT